MQNPEFVREYNALEPEYKLAVDLIRLRLAKGLTQEDLAKLLNTKQESIARLENGGSLPSLSTMKKLAEALDAELEINLHPKQSRSITRQSPERVRSWTFSTLACSVRAHYGGIHIQQAEPKLSN